MNFEGFMFALLVISTLTSLVTEAVKKILVERDISYRANSLAGITSSVISLGVGVGYVIMTNTAFTAQVIICIIALIFMSWLCAMVGYDKVIQTISQFKTKEENTNA